MNPGAIGHPVRGRVPVPDRDPGALLRQPKPLLALAQGLRGPYPFGDVAGDPPVAEQGAVVAEERKAADLEGDQVAPAVVGDGLQP